MSRGPYDDEANTEPEPFPDDLDDGVTFPATLDTLASPSMANGPFSEAALDAPSNIGRYEIRGVLGQGGMGVVYRAYDSELERLVALKLVLVRGRTMAQVERARQRLLREAQALAQLAHPNVVAVYDVGQHDDDVFIAMELVEGETLKEMHAAGPLPHERVVALMSQAGAGLAAAHRRGLIHRDFKPGNIIVGSDGRVRVVDFGLARSHMTESIDGEGSSRDESGSDEPAPSLLSSPLTQHSAIVGTPAYMSPEQAEGQQADERSDQYSFCVALFELLCSRRPKHDDEPPVLEQEAATAGMPRWLRRTIMRGLSRAPARRFPTMDALLAELDRDVRGRRRRVGIATAFAVLAAVSVWAVASRDSASEGVDCGRAARHLGDAWNRAARGNVRTAFAATGLPHATETADRVTALLDGYADAWAHGREATCRAYHERGEISSEVLDLRMRCFAQRRSALAATARVLGGKVDDVVVNEATRVARRLPAVADCADDEGLRALAPLPEDPEQRAAIARLEGRLDEGEALLRAGRAPRGLELAGAIAADARVVGFAPVTARALILRGNLELELGDQQAADATLREATAAAAAATGALDLEARAWVLRMRSLLVQGRFDEAMTMAEVAQLAVSRAGATPGLRAELAYTMAWLLIMKDDIGPARASANAALELWTEAHGERDPSVALALIMLGNAEMLDGDLADAVAHQQRAIDVLSETLGGRHPDVASALHNQASALLEVGDAERALTAAQRALDIVAGLFPDDHPRRAAELWLVGRAYLVLEQPERAAHHVERALAIYAAAEGAPPSEVAYATRILGDVRMAQKRWADAAVAYRAAMEQFAQLYGPDDSSGSEILLPLAEAEQRLGHRQVAAKLRARHDALAASAAP